MTPPRFTGALAQATLALGLLAAGTEAGASVGGPAGAAGFSEGFEVVVPAGWTARNNSTTIGITFGPWFQPTGEFPAQAGPPTSYAAANFNATAGTGTISTWLISPTLSFNDGDVISFWTRTRDAPQFPDRLELRFSNVGGVDVGTAPDDVGSFTRLLLSVNPDLTTTGYPDTWTRYTSAITGLAGPTDGAIAFRYFVENGGPSGTNGDYIGVDTLSISAVPEPATFLLMALGCAGLLRRRRADRG